MQQSVFGFLMAENAIFYTKKMKNQKFMNSFFQLKNKRQKKFFNAFFGAKNKK